MPREGFTKAALCPCGLLTIWPSRLLGADHASVLPAAVIRTGMKHRKVGETPTLGHTAATAASRPASASHGMRQLEHLLGLHKCIMQSDV